MDTLAAYDLGALYWFGSLHRPWLDPIVESLSMVGNFAVMSVIALALTLGLVALRKPRLAMGLALICVIAFGIQLGVKRLVQRPRPDVAWRRIPLPDEPSFPSGHAFCSMAILTGAGLLYSRALGCRWLVTFGVVSGFAIGLTRPYLGVHYPLDVLSGWIGGLAVALLGVALMVPLETPPPPLVSEMPTVPPDA